MTTTIASSPGNAVTVSWLEPAETVALDEQARKAQSHLLLPIFFLEEAGPLAF